jgi:Na+-transporting NADH:ubiquinone oxidoreductase subunit NqrB
MTDTAASIASARSLRDLYRLFRHKLDARWLQILSIGSLLLFGALLRDFALRWEQVALTFAVGLATQAAWSRVRGLPLHSLLSGAVTCIGLSILVRADSLWVHPLLACLVLSAKFVLRIRGKHLFNPANLGVILAIAVLPGAWASPGQWGSDMLLGLWIVLFGITVTSSANRFDIAFAFLSCWVALLVGRLLILGQAVPVLENQLSNGALLVFSFFMVTDPMTTPNHRSMRLLYAALIAVFAYVWQYHLFIPNGPVWALFLLTPLVPLLDRLKPAAKHEWRPARLAAR